MNWFKNLSFHCNFEYSVTVPSLCIIIVTVLSCMIIPDQANTFFQMAKNAIFGSFSWVYILSVAFFLLFLLILCIGKLGDIRLGEDDEEPDYSLFSWICMLFAAGMGIGLMYFGVAEPMSHYVIPLHSSFDGSMKMKDAMVNTIFHWGLHAWAIYGIVGLSLAYFGYRYQLPLTLRSGFYPVLKKKGKGIIGIAIDVVALCATIFGLTTTLGYGALQLDAGLTAVGFFDSFQFSHIIGLVILAVSLAVFSAVSGVSRGVRYLSQGNLILVIALLLFILFTGPTVYVLSAFTENIGYYLSNLIELSLRTFAYEATQEEWFTNWTIMYWAWWISWAPFVGLFIAKISKARTVREFVSCVLLVPTLFNILWMSVFGNASFWVDSQTGGALSAIINNTEAMLFVFLQFFPLPSLTSFAAILAIFIFFVTSADSGIFVINSLASHGKSRFPRWQSAFWGALLAILALALLYSGGLAALQTMTIVMALPLSILMMLMALCLLRGMIIDTSYFGRGLSKSTSYWDGSRWKWRLKQILSTTTPSDFQQFLQDTVSPAFAEITDELKKNGITATIERGSTDDTPFIEICVKNHKLINFVYGITYKETVLSHIVVEDPLIPTINDRETFEPICYFSDGRRGYSVKYMSKEELITDVLRQFERYMKLASDGEYTLYLYDK